MLGSIMAFPPPTAPPFLPKTGPSDGSLKSATDKYPSLLSESVSPILKVVLPSPYGVGFVLVTKINLPFLLVFMFSIFAL